MSEVTEKVRLEYVHVINTDGLLTEDELHDLAEEIISEYGESNNRLYLLTRFPLQAEVVPQEDGTTLLHCCIGAGATVYDIAMFLDQMSDLHELYSDLRIEIEDGSGNDPLPYVNENVMVEKLELAI